jgi:HD-GYP domain-containing protein (c-di-GMP phosphodiesterase class II)
MSSDRPSADPSPERASEPNLAALLSERGGPLVDALERHLPGARAHAEGTASYAFTAAVGLGFDRAQCQVAREAAVLHEVGLIYVPAEIAALPEERRDASQDALWNEHYEAGYRLALGAGLPSSASAWLLRARERFDGTGPEGLRGESIPIESRLIRAACMCQRTVASAAPGAEKPGARLAIEALAERAGGELDPRVVAALNSILERAAGPRP